jgi:hypothetical protein
MKLVSDGILTLILAQTDLKLFELYDRSFLASSETPMALSQPPARLGNTA